MRALTSLTAHLLGSHPEISGYCELHLDHDTPRALEAQRAALAACGGIKPRSRYLFDKILHNDYRFVPEQLGAPRPSILVSLRAPEHAIPSIVHLFASKAAPHPYASPLEAARYYVERLRALAAFCRATTVPYLYFDAESLLESPAEVLREIGRWLELATPLRERYDVFRETGRAGRGDSSEKMASGVIDPRPSDYAHIEVPRVAIESARAAYIAARRMATARAVCCVLRKPAADADPSGATDRIDDAF